jgi:hypothetical protein
VIRRPLDEGVQERFIAEAGGNPLALLELPQGLTPAELAGAFGVTAPPGLPGRLEDSFRFFFFTLDVHVTARGEDLAVDPVAE